MNLDFFKDAWHGKHRLAEIFWLYYVIGGLGIALLTGLLGVSVFFATGAFTVGRMLVLVPLLAYGAWVLGALWACAFNVEWKGWGYLARAFVVYSVAQLLYGLFFP